MHSARPQARNGTGPSRWYLIQSKPRQGDRAEENLSNQGFQCFFPQVDVQAVVGQRQVTRREPLFPGYLFIQLSEVADNWLPIRSTRGVQRLVTFADKPLPVADTIINAIRDRLAVPDGPRMLFQPGDKVRITEGAFANVEAIFERFNGEERVVLLMNLLHKTQQVCFPLRSVSRID